VTESFIEAMVAMEPWRWQLALSRLSPRQLLVLLHSFALRARGAQAPPPGNWRTWLLMAGRGFGKTRTGAEWVHRMAFENPWARIALVAPTMNDARSVMVEGDSGLLATAFPDEVLHYEPSRRRILFPHGARAFLFSAEEPKALRGPQFHFAWGDEVAHWDDGQTVWSNLRLGMRKGARPRVVLTTTPKPVPLMTALLGDPAVAVTRGRTADNLHNLSPNFVADMVAAYGGTRLGRQELDGELIEDMDGALWTRGGIEGARTETGFAALEPGLRRVVVGVDPPAGDGPGSDACGIVVVGVDRDNVAWVIADASVQGLPPEGWAAAVSAAAARFGADRVAVEVNNGGAMVESVLRAADAGLPVKRVHASRGKEVRAEPVSTHYARGRVKHAGRFPALEDQMCAMTYRGYAGAGSPDRCDALVWAVTELLGGARVAVRRVTVVGAP
jgi:phage terminase large subunit-like protein